MEEKICIKSLLPGELEQLMAELGEPRYRAGQIFKWLHQGVASFDEMSDLPKALRARLEETCVLTRPEILRKQVSRLDGTIKYLFGLSDGNSIETVLMEYEHGNSICVSTQAGCKMGCVFCASFDPARSRNLTPAEILDEILLKAIPAPRAELSEFAPKMLRMNIDPDKIREVIGKGGSVIQKIVAESGAKIDIDEIGRAHV